MDADVRATPLEWQQYLAVAERKYHTQVSAFLHSGQVQHGIDQARAAARGDVPGLGAQPCVKTQGGRPKFGVDYYGLHGTDERIRLDSIPAVQAAYHEALLTLLHIA
jgi:hypothetical protein